jgi:tetratricopeptide (TPR) repeat protein
MLQRFGSYLLVAFCASLSAAAHAQLIDDIDVRPVGNRAEATIKLAAQVRFVRSSASTNGKTLQVFFQVVQADESGGRVLEESRRSPPSAPVAPFTVSYSTLNQTSTRRLDIVFSQAVKATVRLGPDGRSFVVTLPLLSSPAERAQNTQTATALPATPTATPPSAVPSTTTTPGTSDTPALANPEAQSMLKRAKDALARKDFETALAQFNILLNLPPNETSQEAQELVGAAREGLGETKKARAEYDLYLKLYPSGEGANRVREQLKALDQTPTASAGAAPGTRGGTDVALTQRPTIRSVWGSLSQSYYGGQSRIDTSNIIVTPATNATTIDQQTLTGTDQSSLVTNADVNARIRSGQWETRLAVRDTYTWSFLKGSASRNRLTAAYADVRNQVDQYGIRVGRQSPSGAGVLYRFDGLSGSYNFSPIWKGGVVVGTPAETTLGERKLFYGASIDADGLITNLGTTFYAIEQRVGSNTDRRAIGSELRFNNERVNTIGTIDYDVVFRRLNIGSVQATYTVPEGITVNALYDYRASPPLQLTNGLFGLGVLSVKEALALASLTAAQQYADALTPVSRVALLGFTLPVSKVWQIGLDYRISSVSGTGATPAFPATPATGNIKTISGQAIGTGIWGTSDVLVVSGSYLNAPTYTGYLVAVNPRFVFGANWTLEPILRWYRQTEKTGSTLVRWSPTLRNIYKWSEKISLEAEASWELGRVDSPLTQEKSNRFFYYVGYRYDF